MNLNRRYHFQRSCSIPGWKSHVLFFVTDRFKGFDFCAVQHSDQITKQKMDTYEIDQQEKATRYSYKDIFNPVKLLPVYHNTTTDPLEFMVF